MRVRFRALKRRLPFIIFILLLVTALAVYIDWNWKRKLSPRGGRYFFHRVELAVPSFRQSDEKWRDDPLSVQSSISRRSNFAPGEILFAARIVECGSRMQRPSSSSTSNASSNLRNAHF